MMSKHNLQIKEFPKKESGFKYKDIIMSKQTSVSSKKDDFYDLDFRTFNLPVIVH